MDSLNVFLNADLYLHYCLNGGRTTIWCMQSFFYKCNSETDISAICFFPVCICFKQSYYFFRTNAVQSSA